MKKVSALMLVLALVMGCGTMATTTNSVCNKIPEGETSVICEAAFALNIAPETAASIIKVGNTAALATDAYTSEQALKFIDVIEQFLIQAQVEGLTYAAAMTAAKIHYGTLPKKVQAAFIIVEDLSNVPPAVGGKFLTPYDFAMLFHVVEDQKRIAILLADE